MSGRALFLPAGTPPPRRRFAFGRALLAGMIAIAAPAHSAAQSPRPPAPSPPATAPAPPSLPAAAAAQARRHNAGDFPAMTRRGAAGGQIQGVFDASADTEGVHVFAPCPDCIYKVRTREFMITTVVLPVATRVVSVELGEPHGFQASIRQPNIVAVRPAGYGMDTSMTVHTEGGAVYAFYLRAERFNSRHVPDLLVRIGRAAGFAAATAKDDGNKKREAGGAGSPAVHDLAGVETPPPDFVERVEFDPATLHGWRNYKLWGAPSLRPETVFRDGRFTYLQYGERWPGLDLPAAFVVVDGIDELVNTRVRGRTYIVESTAPLITLKSGRRFLCIQYTAAGS